MILLDVYGSYGIKQGNLIITIGTSLIFDVTCKDENGFPIDLTAFTPTMVVKTPLQRLDWSEYVTVGLGNIHVHVPYGVTGAVEYPGRRTSKFQHGTWDLSIKSNTDDVLRVVYGNVEVADTDFSKVVS